MWVSQVSRRWQGWRKRVAIAMRRLRGRDKAEGRRRFLTCEGQERRGARARTGRARAFYMRTMNRRGGSNCERLRRDKGVVSRRWERGENARMVCEGLRTNSHARGGSGEVEGGEETRTPVGMAAKETSVVRDRGRERVGEWRQAGRGRRRLREGKEDRENNRESAGGPQLACKGVDRGWMMRGKEGARGKTLPSIVTQGRESQREHKSVGRLRDG